jgi:hypothetical protein
VLEFIRVIIPNSNKTKRIAMYLCHFCDSVVERVVVNAERSTSCGCARSMHRTRHGHARIGNHDPIYILWGLMKSRCNNSKTEKYPRYGGRGITVCSEWADSYPAFHSWAISNGWSPGLELDREDNDGNYEPSNCRFVPHLVNVQNSTVAKLRQSDVAEIRDLYAIGGLRYKDIAVLYGVSFATIGHIVNFKTWKV